MPPPREPQERANANEPPQNSPPSKSTAETVSHVLVRRAMRTITLQRYVFHSFEGLSRVARQARANGGADHCEVTAASPATASGSALDDDALIELSRASALAASRGAQLQRSARPRLLRGRARRASRCRRHRSISVTAIARVHGRAMPLAARVRFEFGNVFAVPTQPIFVRDVVPRSARRCFPSSCARLSSSRSCRTCSAGGRPSTGSRSSSSPRGSRSAPRSSSIFWASHPPRWSSVPIYVAALGAQFVFDYASNFLIDAGGREHHSARTASLGACPRSRWMRSSHRSAWSSRSPRYGRAWALVLVLPAAAASSRSSRANASTASTTRSSCSNAYRGTAMLLGDVIEADDEYTGSHSRDVVELVARRRRPAGARRATHASARSSQRSCTTSAR